LLKEAIWKERGSFLKELKGMCFMEKTFRAMQNKAIALFYRMKVGHTAIELLRYYAMGYREVKKSEGKNVYLPLPFGSAVIITHARSFDEMALNSVKTPCNLRKNEMLE
jgi:hypothetical protein